MHSVSPALYLLQCSPHSRPCTCCSAAHTAGEHFGAQRELKVYKFKFDLQPGSLTDQVAGEHQP